MKRLVIDIDGTLANHSSSDYTSAGLNHEVATQLRRYQTYGFEIVLYTSRNMQTHQSNLGKITARTVPVLVDWLNKHSIPYDEIWVGKPWCGHEGFYVDDKAVRPDEFTSMSYEEICELLQMSSPSGIPKTDTEED